MDTRKEESPGKPRPVRRDTASFKYTAFLSYSHEADTALARALQSGLHRIGKPWYRMRAMRTFCDQTGIAANPALWPTIEAALRNAEHLVYLASPDAARSPWVVRELELWRANRSISSVIIVLTDGDLAWNHVAAGFDRERTTALPECLLQWYEEEPRYVDLRWARSPDSWSLRNSAFRDSTLDIAAPLLGRDKDEVDGEDVRQHRNTTRLVQRAVLLLLLLTAIAIWQSLVARKRQAEAEEFNRTAQLEAGGAKWLLADRIREEDPVRAAHLFLGAASNFENADDARSAKDATLAGALTSAPVAWTWVHDPAVAKAKFSPDGSYVVTWGWGPQVCLWRVGDRKPIHVLEHECLNAEIDQDGRRVVTWGADGLANLWEVGDEPSTEVFEHGSRDLSVQFAGTSRVLTTGAGVARLWELGNPSAIQEYGTERALGGATIDRAGKRVVAWAPGTDARVWRVDEPDTPFTIPGTKEVSGAVFSDDGRHLAMWSTDRSVRLWQTYSQPKVTVTIDTNPQGVAFSPDGTRFAAWGLDGPGQIRSSTSGELIQMLPRTTEGDPYKSRLRGMEFSPSGRSLLTWRANNKASLWRIGQEVPEREFVHEGTVNGATFSRDGQYALTWSSDGSIRQWKLGSSRSIAPSGPSPIRQARFLGSSNRLLLWDYMRPMQLTEPGDAPSTAWKALDLTARPGFAVTDVVYSPEASRIVGWGKNLVGVWSPEEAEALHVLDYGSGSTVSGALLSRDGTTALAWSHSGVRFWRVEDPDTTGQILELGSRDPGVLGVALSPDNTTLAVWGNRSHVLLWQECAWRTPDAEPTQTLSHDHIVNDVAFGSSSDKVVTCGADKTVRLWSIGQQDPVQVFRSGEAPARVRFGSDETRIWSWGGSRLQQWQVGSDEPVHSLDHGSALVGIAFGGEGRAVTWGQGGAKLWAIDQAAPIHVFEEERRVSSATLGAAGRWLCTVSNRGTELWDLGLGKPESIEKRQLELAARTATRLDGSGELRTLSPDQHRGASPR
ncbi:MAG: TIR domain-containing protein [Planctomycetota bacterium]